MDSAFEERLHQELKDAFVNGRHDYNSVHVLLVYWEQSDNAGFQTEAQQIGEVFDAVFQFSIQEFKIPSKASELALEVEVGRWILQYGGFDTLLIVYYGGHGDEDFDISREWDRQGVWAANQQGDPKLNWYNIQPKFSHTQSDVLLIFDCCFSGQAARGHINVNGRVELLAACSPTDKVPGPGPKSFTTGLIKELKSAVESLKTSPLPDPITVSSLHRQLVRKETRLSKMASLVVLQPGINNKSIRLEPLYIRSHTPQPVSSINLQIYMKDHLNELTLRKIFTWLKNDAPHIVSEVRVKKAIQTTEKVYGFILEESTESRPLPPFQLLDPKRQQEIILCWQNLVAQLASELPILKSSLRMYTENSDKSQQMIDSFVKRLDLSVSALSRTVERNIVATSRMNEKESLLKAVEEESFKDVGFADTLRLRLLAITESTQNESLEIEVLSSNSHGYGTENPLPTLIERDADQIGHVLVEYKYYDKTTDGNPKSLSLAARRVQSLTEILHISKSPDFNSLHCINWFHEPGMSRYALAFQIPFGFQSRPISLYDIIRTSRSNARPSLGQRFLIARTIGQALQKWHLAGWVHQGIMSRNIFFFQRLNSVEADYETPYLCGFEYARPHGAPSYARFVKDFSINVYNHSERQGEPNQQHRKDHDLYSFGVLLCEIGLWVVIEELFRNIDKDTLQPLRMQNTIRDHAKLKLGFHMGNQYRQATLTCLEREFGVKEDDVVNSRLSKAFEELVLDRIGVCIELN